MAESLRAKIEDHLSCAICLEHFKDPKVLPCQHTFCLECIVKLDMSGNMLTCPECRAITEVPRPPDVSFLPSNFFAKNLLATLATTSDTAEPIQTLSKDGTKTVNPTQLNPPQTHNRASATNPPPTDNRPHNPPEAHGPPRAPNPPQSHTQPSTPSALPIGNRPSAPPTGNQSHPTNPPRTPSPPRCDFPQGCFVGDRIFRYGIHDWSLEIDHSDCPGDDACRFQMGVISHVNASVVAFGGFIKPGCCEDFSLELDMPDETLTVDASWLCESAEFDVYLPRMSPYLKLNCETCLIAVTGANFHWHFQRHL